MNERTTNWNMLKHHAAIYEGRVPTIEATRLVIHDVLNQKFPGQEKILELGSGVGVLPTAASSAVNKRLVSLDINLDPLRVSKENQLSSNYVQSDILNLPFQSDQFEYATGLTFLSSMQHPQQGLKEINRVLKPGGTFIHFLDIIPDFEQQIKFLQKKGKIPFANINEKGKINFSIVDKKTLIKRFDVDKIKRIAKRILGIPSDETFDVIARIFETCIDSPYEAIVSVINGDRRKEKDSVGAMSFAKSIITILDFLGIKREELKPIDEIFGEQMTSYLKAAGFRNIEINYVERIMELPRSDYENFSAVADTNNNIFINRTGRTIPGFDPILARNRPNMIKVISEVQVISATK